MFIRLIGLLVFLHASIAGAVTLDWNQIDWLQGDTQHTYTNVQGSGIDVTISINLSNDRATYRNPYNWWDRYTTTTDWINDAPNDNNTFGGDGRTQNDESLYLGLNFATNDRTKSYLDVTISFSQPVINTSFSLFDVDAFGYNYQGGYETGIQFVDVIEQIEAKNNATDAGNANVGYYSDKITAVTNDGATSYYGNTSLYNSEDQNDNPHSAMALNWGQQVDTVSFRYTTGTTPVRDPGNQAISLSNISFHRYNAVPEPGTIFAGSLCGLLLLGLTIRKRLAGTIKLQY